MSNKDISLGSLIREYLLDEGILREKIKSSDFEFGYVISFPPGPKGQNMSIYKTKNKNCVYITIRTQISEKFTKPLSSSKGDKTFQIFNKIRKYFLIKEVFFRIDVQNFIIEIHEQIYPDRDRYISKDALFKGIQKVLYCYIYSHILLEEFSAGKEISSTEFGPEFDLSLYS
jgi:hypothetical protein